MLVIVTGAKGSAVSTVGRNLAKRLALPVYDGTGDSSIADGGAVLATPSLEPRVREALVHTRSARVVYLKGKAGAEDTGGGPPADAMVIPADLDPIEMVERVARQLIHKGFHGRGKVYFAEGSASTTIDSKHAAELVDDLVAALGPLQRVLLLPPDYTRYHSGAGELTSMLYERLVAKRATVHVLPTLGTHAPMTDAEIEHMFPGVPEDRVRIHDWRTGLRTLGEVPASYVREVSGGRVDYPIRCEIDARLVDGAYDRIISVGQLVPHEVVGIAGHDKNVFVGAGGKDIIDRTHFLGAVCGMESIMGRQHSPVRDVLMYMSRQLARELPITHLLTVRQRQESGTMVTRGLFAGDDYACFAAGVPLVHACNLELFDEAPRKMVVYLDPSEFKSTWLGNKSVYRTRMAIADDGELLVLAPGVARFGEDPGIDRLIRKHGYHGTPRTLEAVKSDPDLGASLSAAAHLIHGSSEGRFRIAYAAGGLSRDEVIGVGYEHADLDESMRRYDPTKLRPGKNVVDGEEIFFVPNPAVGLWGLRDKFASR